MADRCRPVVVAVCGALIGTPVAATPASTAPAQQLADVRFWMEGADIEQPSCGGCARPAWLRIGHYQLDILAPAAAVFERFDVGGAGRVEFEGVSPDGRTVHAILWPGSVVGRHALTAVFRLKDGALATSSRTFDVQEERPFPDCLPSPCADREGPRRDEHVASTPRSPRAGEMTTAPPRCPKVSAAAATALQEGAALPAPQRPPGPRGKR